MKSGVIARFLLVVVLTLGGVGSAAAYNVPGSGNLILGPTTRVAAGMIIDQIRTCAGRSGGRGGDGRDLGATLDVTQSGMGVTRGDLQWHFDQTVGSGCISTLVRGTGLGDLRIGVMGEAEHGSGLTDFNQGTLTESGGGAGIFISAYPSQFLELFVAGGVSALGFDMTRASGAVFASFTGWRLFATFGAAGTIDLGPAFLDASASARYSRLQTSSYQEGGSAFGIAAPGLVPEMSFQSLTLNGEVKFGQHFGMITPYGILGFQHELFSDPTLALPLGGSVNLTSQMQTTGTVGAGVEVAFRPDAIFKLETRYSIGDQGYSQWAVIGRLGVKF